MDCGDHRAGGYPFLYILTLVIGFEDIPEEER